MAVSLKNDIKNFPQDPTSPHSKASVITLKDFLKGGNDKRGRVHIQKSFGMHHGKVSRQNNLINPVNTDNKMMNAFKL